MGMQQHISRNWYLYAFLHWALLFSSIFSKHFLLLAIMYWHTQESDQEDDVYNMRREGFTETTCGNKLYPTLYNDAIEVPDGWRLHVGLFLARFEGYNTYTHVTPCFHHKLLMSSTHYLHSVLHSLLPLPLPMHSPTSTYQAQVSSCIL